MMNNLVLTFCLIAIVSARRRHHFDQLNDATSFEADGLAAHNKYRSIHFASPLALDNALSAQATLVAEKLAALPGITLKHSDSEGKYGENLFASCTYPPKPATAEDATASWYNEVCEAPYDFNHPGFHSGTGHFTQVVWDGSRKLGMGYATKLLGGMYLCTFVVAQYTPPGNVMGKFGENVNQGNFKSNSCAQAEDEIDDEYDDIEAHIFTETSGEMKDFTRKINRDAHPYRRLFRF